VALRAEANGEEDGVGRRYPQRDRARNKMLPNRIGEDGGSDVWIERRELGSLFERAAA
jgi:hypothetical protein